MQANLKKRLRKFAFIKIIIIYFFITIKLYSMKIKNRREIDDKNININPLDLSKNGNRFNNNYQLFEYYKNLDIYKYFKFPLISMILLITNNSIENEIQTLLRELNKMKKKENIEIIISCSKNKTKVNNIINKYSYFNKDFKIIQVNLNKTSIYNQLFQLIEKCRGRFLILINIFSFD